MYNQSGMCSNVRAEISSILSPIAIDDKMVIQSTQSNKCTSKNGITNHTTLALLIFTVHGACTERLYCLRRSSTKLWHKSHTYLQTARKHLLDSVCIEHEAESLPHRFYDLRRASVSSQLLQIFLTQRINGCHGCIVCLIHLQ